MQIISGKYKGKKLVTLAKASTRPTLNRIKENVFNILENYIHWENKIVVEPFAGSGALAIEALSRGAQLAYVNDIDKEAVKVIHKNVTNTEMENRIQTFNEDYQSFIKKINFKIDLLFLDPPYKNQTAINWTLNYLHEKNILQKNALIIIEVDDISWKLSLNSNFKCLSAKKYGKIYIKIMEYN